MARVKIEIEIEQKYVDELIQTIQWAIDGRRGQAHRQQRSLNGRVAAQYNESVAAEYEAVVRQLEPHVLPGEVPK